MTQAAEALQAVGAALRQAAERLAAAGIEAPRRDARLLIAHVLDAGVEQVVGYPERPLSREQAARLETLVARRARREPVSRILGRREFWGLELALSEATLDPRPDSETLVEALLAALPDRAARLRVLDLGSGSGCLLLALLSELPAASGLGLDVSAAAVETARRNAARLGLEDRARFALGDWRRGLQGDWPVIVCNPPYIAEGEIAGLAPEVAGYDPYLALAGGRDGLAAYRVLAPAVAGAIADGGVAALEIGVGQAEAVEALLRQAGLSAIERRSDLSGSPRCLLIRAGRAKKKVVGKAGGHD